MAVRVKAKPTPLCTRHKATEKQVQRFRPTLTDLPLPQGGPSRHPRQWRLAFNPYIISWAGNQEDPFGTTGRMDRAIKSAWRHVYPTVPLDDGGMDIVVIVVHLLFEIMSLF